MARESEGLSSHGAPETVAGTDSADVVRTLRTDASGRLITIGAGGALDPQKAEDSAHADGDAGTYVLAVRSDAATASAAAGDYHSFQVDASGRLWSHVENPTAANLKSEVVGPAADGAAASGNPVLVAGSDGATVQTLAVNSDGEVGVHDGGNSLTVDAPVATPVASRLSDGTAFLTTTSGRLSVDGSGVTQPVSGTVSADTELPAAAALSDAFANPTAPAVGSMGMLFDGTDWERQRVADAASVSGTLIPDGVALSAAPGNWSAKDEPAVDTVATATRAAGAVGVRHVATAILACITTGAASAVSTVQLKDGTTIVFAGRIKAQANSSSILALSGLSIFGTAATDMTLEVSDPADAGAQVTASLSGYSVGA